MTNIEMANLSCIAIAASDLAVNNKCSSNSRAYRNKDGLLKIFSRAAAQFCDGATAHIMAKCNGKIYLFGYQLFDGKIFPAKISGPATYSLRLI